MAILAFDDYRLRAPELLMARTAPLTTSVKLADRWARQVHYIYCPAVDPLTNRLSNSATAPTVTSTISLVGTSRGRAALPASDAFILSNIGPPATEPNNTHLAVIVPRAFTATAYLFQTRYNPSFPSYYAGINWSVTTGGLFFLNYGDSTGLSPTDRRSLQGARAMAPGMAYAACGHFLSATTGSLWINGVKDVLTASGSGGAVGGSGNIYVHNRPDVGLPNLHPMLLMVVFNVQLPEADLIDLSTDPFQLFDLA